ncbi:MAG: zinc ribbon domain-containing protein [Anaerolineae bacterium]
MDAAYHKSDLRRHGVEFVSATQKVPENFAVLYDESEFLLTGLVFCGNCGRALESGTDMRNAKTGKGNPWRYYRCRGQRLEEGACQHTERINARQPKRKSSKPRRYWRMASLPWRVLRQ